MTAVKAADYTAVNGDLVLCDISGGSFTVTLPNAAANGERIGIKVVNSAAGNSLTIDGDSTDIIGVKGDNGTTAALYLTNDYLEMIFENSSAKWHTVSEHVTLHSARIEGSSS